MRQGYREQACPACGRRFPTLARAPGVWCSYACAWFVKRRDGEDDSAA